MPRRKKEVSVEKPLDDSLINPLSEGWCERCEYETHSRCSEIFDVECSKVTKCGKYKKKGGIKSA